MSGVERLAESKLPAMEMTNRDLDWARQKLKQLLRELYRRAETGRLK